MTKSKSSGLSIIIPSIFLIHLVNGTEFLNATWVGTLCTVVATSQFTKR